MIQCRPPVTPQPAQADPRAALSLQLERALATPPYDVHAICRLGNAAYKMGMGVEASRAFEASVAILLEMIRRGDADAALAAEGAIYQAFVKAVENEDHYERVFALWREPMAELGRRFRGEAVAAAPDAKAIAFVFHAGVVLGHTEVLFRLLESRDPAKPVRIYAIGACQPDFVARAQALGVPVEAFPEKPRWGGGAGTLVERVRWLRARMAADGVRTAVWVSYPGTALFAFAMGLAPVQVMWSLRYHPVRMPEIDGYLTYGSWAEDARVFHGQRWTVCPVPLALDPRRPPAGEVAALRARFPEPVLLGTLAREEKIDSRPFLESVAAILKRNPQCGYVWTGHSMHPGVANFFHREGVASRCHFVGWVDTPLYASILDVFLETFPLGCGITGYQAIGAGVPLVSYLDSNTVFGMQYWSELMARAGEPARVTREALDEYPVLCARDPQEYVALVSRLIDDPAFRDSWRAREARFYAEEIDGIARYSRRFFAALDAVDRAKAG
jgi:glycosyltransferase involved in cell wall biosynthesis